jgi:hypothetical protein
VKSKKLYFSKSQQPLSTFSFQTLAWGTHESSSLLPSPLSPPPLHHTLYLHIPSLSSLTVRRGGLPGRAICDHRTPLPHPPRWPLHDGAGGPVARLTWPVCDGVGLTTCSSSATLLSSLVTPPPPNACDRELLVDDPPPPTLPAAPQKLPREMIEGGKARGRGNVPSGAASQR